MSTLVYEQRLVEEERTELNSLSLNLALICFFSLVFPIHTLPFLQAQEARDLPVLLALLRGLTLTCVLWREDAQATPPCCCHQESSARFQTGETFYICLFKEIFCIDFS